MSLADQRGRSRDSGAASISAAMFSTASSPPGAGQAITPRWCAGSKPESSAQMGRPQPKGTETSRWRSRGTVPSRRASASRRGAESSLPSVLSMRMAPTCIGAEPMSASKDIMSSALTLSTCCLGVIFGPRNQISEFSALLGGKKTATHKLLSRDSRRPDVVVMSSLLGVRGPEDRAERPACPP